jgi:hypothetical protein
MKSLLFFFFCLSPFISGYAQKLALEKPFLHPGMLQTAEDMDYMKQKIRTGEEPWKTAFENLKKETSLAFQAEPFTHVAAGPYGTGNSGAQEFDENGKAAYNHALMWYITENKHHADKAIEILNAWSDRLWDFDSNNAKLIVGLFAPYFLNAAEILRYTDSGWKEKEREQFTRMVLMAFYPTIRDFFTEANGNWDASIIYALLCMGVFLDNQEIFDQALERFYRGPGNSGITKYIYPTGQCQETTRDWSHVQLGIGELAKAAQLAWTQGIDLYRVADNRLALGFEYAAAFLSGRNIPAFGIVSQRDKNEFRDVYESIYNHYKTVKEIEMPYTERIILNHTREKSSIGMLSAVKVSPKPPPVNGKEALIPDTKAKMPLSTGALDTPAVTPPRGLVIIQSGESIQEAIDKMKGTDQWIFLTKGIHILSEPLRMESNITLAGEGKETILILNPNINGMTIVNATNNMHDVTIRDLLIEGATQAGIVFDPNEERRRRSYMNAPSRGGILFSADAKNQIKNIRLENLTIQNCTKNGISLKGVSGIKTLHCDFSDNGSSVVPGAGFHHNMHMTRVEDIYIENSRFDTSPWGSGIDFSFARNIVISANEFARNKLFGIRCSECENISIVNNLIEGNDRDGICFDFGMDGSSDGIIKGNLLRNNGLSAIAISNSRAIICEGNMQTDNGKFSDNRAMHPKWQIEFVKKQLAMKNEPYYSAYLQLIHAADSVRFISHHAPADFVVPGFYDKPEEHRANSLAIQQDAFGAYCSALAYCLSDEKKYGEKACYFLNAWASVNTKYSGHDGVLVMTYSGSGLLIAAELMAEAECWENGERKEFERWVKRVYRKAANEIREHKNNWADWGRFGSLMAASFLNDREEIAENFRLIESDLSDKIAPDGSMPEETRRGDNGIWYTYFSLAPMTAAFWLIYNLTGENLFVWENNNASVKKALDYLAYYNQHPAEWPWHEKPHTGKTEVWPENLLEAVSGIYQDENQVNYVKDNRPIMYSKHHFAWSFPTLMPLKNSR